MSRLDLHGVRPSGLGEARLGCQEIEERVVSSECRWRGQVFSVDALAVGLADGSQGHREIVRHHGGAGVCAVHEGCLCLVRQYRVALGRVTLEIPAGRLDEGEDAKSCAARELLEETGLRARELELLACAYGSPGFTDESTHIYLARGLGADDARPDEGELVDVVWVPLEQLREGISQGVIQDGKTIIAVLAACARGLS